MKHFGIYRKLILIIGTATAVVSVGVFFFMEDILFRTLFISFAFVFLCGLLFLMDFLHNRYNDNLLEEITLLIEALVEQQERMVFSEAEDTLTARLQHQLLKLRNILKAQNQMLTQEKEQIKTLISDISHACGLVLDNGMELLLHIGIDTVEMQGDGFEYLIKEGQEVKAGTPLIRFNRQKIKEAGYSDVTVCVITDGADEKTVHFHTGIYAQENETVIIEIE